MPNSHLPRPETAEQALEMLKQGNARFVENVQNPQSTLLASNALTHVHEPFAIILGCSDARVPAEIVFDQGLGDLFVNPSHLVFCIPYYKRSARGSKNL